MRVFDCRSGQARTMGGAAAACLLYAAALSPLNAGAAQSSPALVKQLVAAMAARQLDAIAAADPREPGRFVAALVFPDVQMLLVSSRHDSVDYLTQQIAQRQFRDVYVALQGGPAAGRLFFHDMGCDGLLASAENADVVYEGADGRTIFNGDWLAQSLTEEAYAAKHKDADERYSRALTVLLEAVKRPA